ncbi:MAG TPA: PIG-L deacetylase family protein [Vicinamibacterales bacterium]|nr:PIG-L deacetylase family protein [Vicinamibacterales bacterium]
MPDGSLDGPPLAGRTVLGIFAHPDDESLACGGTLARLADAGARVVLLCASRGEAGSISDPALVPDGDLGLVRERELRDAAAVLGVAEVIILNHPDGVLRWDHVPELHDEIVDAIRRYRPDVVITFAEDGLYWHLDHIGVHERTYTAVHSFGPDAPPLYYVTMQSGVMREVVRAAHEKGGAPAGSSLWGIAPEAFGDSAKPPTLVVDVRDWVPRKLAALRCHRTQMGPNNPVSWIDDEQARLWLGTEQFRRATIEATGAPVLERIGEHQIQHAD